MGVCEFDPRPARSFCLLHVRMEHVGVAFLPLRGVTEVMETFGCGSKLSQQGDHRF